MNTKIILLLFAVIILFACNSETETKIVVEDIPVDMEAIEKEINAEADKFFNAMKTIDVEAIDILFHEDGLFLGTDPKEFWVKDTIMNMFYKLVEDSIPDFEFAINKRAVKLTPEGKSALVIEQFFHPFISEIVEIRKTCRYINVENNWKIDFIDWALIPKNEDLGAINEVLKNK